MALHEIRVRSYWGAISSLLTLYCVGYFLLEGFIANSKSPIIIPMLLWFLLYIVIERIVTGRIHDFLANKNNVESTFLPRTKKEIWRMVFALIMLVAAIFLTLGYYPFEKQISSWWMPIMFNIICFSVSWFTTKSTETSLQVAGGRERIIALFGCSVFMIIGIFKPEVRYIAGMMGLEAVTFLTIGWLLEND